MSNASVPLPRVWAQFVSLSENKADLTAFLSEDLVKIFPNVPAGCDLVLATEWVNNYVSCPTALLVSPKLTVHEIVSASHGERGLLFLKQQSICSASEIKTNLSQLAMIVFCPEHQKMKLMSNHLLSSSNDLAYFLCVELKLLP